MKFGVCCKIQDIDRITKFGFDFLELRLSEIAGLEESEFEALLKKVKELDTPVKAFNLFFNKDIHIIGDADRKVIEKYVQHAMKRASRLGGELAVLGNGGARRIPDGFDRDKAYKQFADVLRLCADIAAEYGIMIALEPLNINETNLINTVAEAKEFTYKLSHPNVGYIADFFHIYTNGESTDALGGDRLWHTHIARPDPSRSAPEAEDIPTLRAWASALKECGYDGRISLECAGDALTNAQKWAEMIGVFR